MTTNDDLQSRITAAKAELAEAVRVRDLPQKRVADAEQALHLLVKESKRQQAAEQARLIAAREAARAGCKGFKDLLADAEAWLADAQRRVVASRANDAPAMADGTRAAEAVVLLAGLSTEALATFDAEAERRVRGIPHRPKPVQSMDTRNPAHNPVTFGAVL